MVSGPSKKWRHLHKFHDLDHGQKTEVVDQVDFELPYGIIVKLFEGMDTINRGKSWTVKK